MFQKITLVISGFLLLQCQKKESSTPILPFETKPITAQVTAGIIDEASGMVACKSVPGYLWIQQDGGNPAEIILIKDKGLFQKRILLKGAVNRDWEDMASGTGPIADSNYIYIAETGDNNAVHSSYSIYRFVEPRLSTDTVFQFDKINFQYPDGSHDAEAIFVSPQKDIYIITKRNEKAKVYKLAYPQTTGSLLTASAVGALQFTGVTGAACNGKEILVKTYTQVYYWKMNGNELPEITLRRTPLQLGYEAEPQGEAICFQQKDHGFFTLSEKPFFASSVTLNYYKRK